MLADHFEVEGKRAVRVQSANLPLRRASNTQF